MHCFLQVKLILCGQLQTDEAMWQRLGFDAQQHAEIEQLFEVGGYDVVSARLGMFDRSFPRAWFWPSFCSLVEAAGGLTDLLCFCLLLRLTHEGELF